MVAAAALILVAGITNAQVASKQPVKATAAKEVVHTKKNITADKPAASTASVTPTAKNTNTSNKMIKRRHHHKSNKAAKKTVTK